jgi:hypothetical protein
MARAKGEDEGEDEGGDGDEEGDEVALRPAKRPRIEADHESSASAASSASSVRVLLRFSELCEVLDVPDDPCGAEKGTRDVLFRRFLHPLRSLSSLTSDIRARSRELTQQARANASIDWELDVPPGMVVQEDCLARKRSRSSKGSVHNDNILILKSEAISDGSKPFYGDIDPRLIRRKQLIESVTLS